MRILLIIAFLVFPSIGFSGVGDVYFCESTKFIGLKNGEVKNYKNEKFKFKRTSDGLVFGSEDGSFKNLELEVKSFDFETELFMYGNKKETVFSYEEGIFTFGQVTYQDVTSMIGKCSVF